MSNTQAWSESFCSADAYLHDLTFFTSDSSILDELSECFLSHPQFDDDNNYPLNFLTIRKYQEESKTLLEAVKQAPKRFTVIQYGQHRLICYKLNDDIQQSRIYIPTEILTKLVHWYHEQWLMLKDPITWKKPCNNICIIHS